MRKQDEAIRRLEDLIPDPVTNENLPVFHALCEAIRCVELIHGLNSAQKLMQNAPDGIEPLRELAADGWENHRRQKCKKYLKYAFGSAFGIAVGIVGNSSLERGVLLLLFACCLLLSAD